MANPLSDIGSLYLQSKSSIDFGCSGSKIQKFIRENYERWNVANWVEHATRRFSHAYSGCKFQFCYTPTGDLGNIHVQDAIFHCVVDAKEQHYIAKYTNTCDYYAVMSVSFYGLRDWQDTQRIFGGTGGNSFFFGGEFEAEQVDDSKWHDIKKFEITGLNFMDRLGKKTQVLPSV
jgi:hypothetical protein